MKITIAALAAFWPVMLNAFHDVGSTDVCPCFIVSKFIAGRTLAQRIQENRPSFGEAADDVKLLN